MSRLIATVANKSTTSILPLNDAAQVPEDVTVLAGEDLKQSEVELDDQRHVANRRSTRTNTIIDVMKEVSLSRPPL